MENAPAESIVVKTGVGS